jgi:hypothetical protein
MSSDSAYTETDRSNTFDAVETDIASTFLAPGQDDGNDSSSGDVTMTGAPVGGAVKSAAKSIVEFADEIETLKKKINDLERDVKVDSSENIAQERVADSQGADFEEYKRMEECLYRHRKEWEMKGGPETWRLYTDNTLGDRTARDRYWSFISTPMYSRPNPFNLSHNCASNKDNSGVNAYEDYDHDIDFGNRRERLRRNFEWDLDRLFLAEEIDKRRRFESKEGKNAPDNEENGTFSEPKLNRIHWPAFKQLRMVKEEEACALDILIGEPTVNDDHNKYRRWYGYSGHRSRKLENTRDRKAYDTNKIEQAPLPERIRIHSRILRHIIATILKSQTGISVNVIDHKSIVIVRPFKSIFYCKEALQGWYTALNKKLNAASGTEKSAEVISEEMPGNNATERNISTEKPTVTKSVKQAEESSEDSSNYNRQIEEGKDEEEDEDEGEEDEDDDSSSNSDSGSDGDRAPDRDNKKQREKRKKLNGLAKSQNALDHLKCLLDFMNTDLSKRVDYLNGPQCRKVFFSDLWLLFRPGMEVIGGDGKQAYRVISVTSAKHRVAADWERWNNNLSDDRRKTSPFNITCIYIDFDGKNLGPVTKVFDFKRFDGEKDITLLEVYPLRFHPVKQSDFDDLTWTEAESLPTSQKYRRKLIRRGSMFLDVASVKHMYYAGPTLEVRDDVESQVVIDFETAFSVEDEVQKQWKPALQTLIGNPSPEEDDEKPSDDKCRGSCCQGDFVYDDSYIDKQQNTDYVNSLLPKATSSNEQPSVAILPRPLKELWPSSDKIPSISDDELAIMSYRVFGFVLRSRKWGKSSMLPRPVIVLSSFFTDKILVQPNWILRT